MEKLLINRNFSKYMLLWGLDLIYRNRKLSVFVGIKRLSRYLHCLFLVVSLYKIWQACSFFVLASFPWQKKERKKRKNSICFFLVWNLSLFIGCSFFSLCLVIKCGGLDGKTSQLYLLVAFLFIFSNLTQVSKSLYMLQFCNFYKWLGF